MKKTWGAPKLIVLIRAQPEEAVLGYCKAGYLEPLTGPNEYFNACYYEPTCALTICASPNIS